MKLLQKLSNLVQKLNSNENKFTPASKFDAAEEYFLDSFETDENLIENNLIPGKNKKSILSFFKVDVLGLNRTPQSTTINSQNGKRKKQLVKKSVIVPRQHFRKIQGTNNRHLFNPIDSKIEFNHIVTTSQGEALAAPIYLKLLGVVSKVLNKKFMNEEFIKNNISVKETARDITMRITLQTNNIDLNIVQLHQRFSKHGITFSMEESDSGPICFEITCSKQQINKIEIKENQPKTDLREMEIS